MAEGMQNEQADRQEREPEERRDDSDEAHTTPDFSDSSDTENSQDDMLDKPQFSRLGGFCYRGCTRGRGRGRGGRAGLDLSKTGEGASGLGRGEEVLLEPGNAQDLPVEESTAPNRGGLGNSQRGTGMSGRGRGRGRGEQDGAGRANALEFNVARRPGPRRGPRGFMHNGAGVNGHGIEEDEVLDANEHFLNFHELRYGALADLLNITGGNGRGRGVERGADWPDGAEFNVVGWALPPRRAMHNRVGARGRGGEEFLVNRGNLWALRFDEWMGPHGLFGNFHLYDRVEELGVEFGYAPGFNVIDFAALHPEGRDNVQIEENAMGGGQANEAQDDEADLQAEEFVDPTIPRRGSRANVHDDNEMGGRAGRTVHSIARCRNRAGPGNGSRGGNNGRQDRGANYQASGDNSLGNLGDEEGASGQDRDDDVQAVRGHAYARGGGSG